MICPQCNTEVPEGSTVCPSCGASLVTSEAKTETVASSTAPTAPAAPAAPSAPAAPDASVAAAAPVAAAAAPSEPQAAQPQSAAAPVQPAGQAAAQPNTAQPFAPGAVLPQPQPQQYQQAPQYQQATYQQPVVEQKTDGKAIGALVCGIVGLFAFGLVLGIISLVLGIQVRNKYPKGTRSYNFAIAGIVLGILDLVGWAIALLLLGSVGVMGVSSSMF